MMERTMKSHYHPPRYRSVLCISDERIKCMACNVVKRAEQKVLRELQQDIGSRKLQAFWEDSVERLL